MTVSAAAGAVQTQHQSTIDDLRGNLEALAHLERTRLASEGSGRGASALRLGQVAGARSSVGANVQAGAVAEETSQVPAQPHKARLRATAQPAGPTSSEVGRAVMQAVSLAQAQEPELDVSIWGQGNSRTQPMSAEERRQWVSSVMQDLSQKHALSQTDAGEIARSLYLQPANEAISTQDIREGILAIMARHKDDPQQAAFEVLRGALLHGLNAQQIADTGLVTPQQIDQYVQSLFKFFTLAEWDAVKAQAIVPAVRPQLKAMGLTGAGVRVRVLEVENWGDHPKAVTGIINHEWHGLAPGVAVELDAVYSDSYPQQPIGKMLRNAVANSGLPKGHPQAWVRGLRDTLITAVRDSFRDAAREVREFTYKSGARVLNMSFGSSLTSYYDLVDRMLVFYPELHDGFFADTPGPMSEAQQLQKIVKFVNDTLIESDQVMQSYHNYVNATSEAARSGKTIVVAAGNWQDDMERIRNKGVRMPQWAAMNVMGLSPNVIAVGASSTNGTPNNLLDDKVALFSSNGNEQFPVTLATQGVQASVSYVLFTSLDGQVNGTSFAAPLATGVIALMLQQNPHLTFEQIKSILQTTAMDTPAPMAKEGAGMLDVMKAVTSV